MKFAIHKLSPYSEHYKYHHQSKENKPASTTTTTTTASGSYFNALFVFEIGFYIPSLPIIHVEK